MKKTLGGDRLGSGKKMQVDLKTYNRSTHNLSYDWKSSMACGTLVPFMKILAINGDTFDIDLDSKILTKPTIAPLFGTFKVQLDIFSVPIRLYNGLLHNNATSIGQKMNQVLLPKLIMRQEIEDYNKDNSMKLNSSSLMKYLGISGIGTIKGSRYSAIERSFNAVPLLGYYDIWKNYYSNKQETNGYIITTGKKAETPTIESISFQSPTGTKTYTSLEDFNNDTTTWLSDQYITIYGQNLGENGAGVQINGAGFTGAEGLTASTFYTLQQLVDKNCITINTTPPNNPTNEFIQIMPLYPAGSGRKIQLVETDVTYNNEPTPFPLQNIDDMRYKILTTTGFNNSVKIVAPNQYGAIMPYCNNASIELCKQSQNGLALKTYQSDIFNNWLSSEFIEGINGISQVTAVSTSAGSFTMDALNLAQKVYNMLNLIVAAGNSYEDWQEAKWGTDTIRRAESPVYEGGASFEIGFSPVVSTAETNTEAGGAQALGTLAGKGGIIEKKGGHVTIKIKEPSYIIGIVSITPRISYSQGNDWDIHLENLDELHSPELDGIGFQDLIQEEMAWWSTSQESQNGEWIQKAAGKTPAWINYMTAVSKVYGDFADEEKAGFMVLDRKYNQEDDEISDLTTYIDPRKYNYAFADTSIEAQNFWVQIAANVIARRKMSAQIMPTL